MLFCRKCGAPMEDGDHVCLKCGTVVGQENEAENKKELINKLTDYQRLLSENEELETMIKPQKNFPVTDVAPFKKRAFIRYFWPYIIGATGAFYIVYLLAVGISTYSRFNSYNPYTTSFSKSEMELSLMGDYFIGMAVGAIVAFAIIFIGIKVSKSKQAAINRNAEIVNEELSERYKKGLLNQKMIDLHTSNEHKMLIYEDLVPEQYRTSELVASIIAVLKEDKAQTVEEAIKLI